MRIYEVGEVGEYVKTLLEADDLLADLWIKGEVTNVNRSGAGHYYFSLKDGLGQLRAVMFRGHALRGATKPSMGDDVVAHGRFSFYQQTGVCEFIVDLLYPSGIGIAQLQFEALRLRLEEEGLFAPERKRALPQFPRRIGLVTSASGAALHDVLNILSRRYPIGEVIFAASSVQGDQAPAELVAALSLLRNWRGSDALGVDVVIVGRGGGSPEELSCFNDERVARAIFGSPWPVVSAIGHETDFTICDYVADLRAPTPSAAAELVAPDVGAIRREISELVLRASSLTRSTIQSARADTAFQERRLAVRSPAANVARLRQTCRDQAARGRQALSHRLSSARDALVGRRFQIEALSPRATLSRGYAIVTRPGAQVVRTTEGLGRGDELEIELARGAFQASVTKIAD